MIPDTVDSLMLAFGAVFLCLGLYLVRLSSLVQRIEKSLATDK